MLKPAAVEAILKHMGRMDVLPAKKEHTHWAEAETVKQDRPYNEIE